MSDMKVNGLSTGVPSVISKPEASPKAAPTPKSGLTDFNSVFLDRLNGDSAESGLQFSAHAIKRMAERNIELGAMDMQKIKEALAKVSEKGSRESLVISEKGAFIVDVRESKVITAIDPQSARDSTFTNIDSTVII